MEAAKPQAMVLLICRSNEVTLEGLALGGQAGRLPFDQKPAAYDAVGLYSRGWLITTRSATTSGSDETGIKVTPSRSHDGASKLSRRNLEIRPKDGQSLGDMHTFRRSISGAALTILATLTGTEGL